MARPRGYCRRSYAVCDTVAVTELSVDSSRYETRNGNTRNIPLRLFHSSSQVSLSRIQLVFRLLFSVSLWPPFPRPLSSLTARVTFSVGWPPSYLSRFSTARRLSLYDARKSTSQVASSVTRCAVAVPDVLLDIDSSSSILQASLPRLPSQTPHCQPQKIRPLPPPRSFQNSVPRHQGHGAPQDFPRCCRP